MGPEMLLFFKLLFGHAVADFALQSDSMAVGKRGRILFVPVGQKPQVVWPYWLTAHALIHGTMAWLITGSVCLGLVMTVMHWLTDFGKTRDYYGIHMDQTLHMVTLAFIALWGTLVTFP
jgi:Protein of unknown function (DUF3307)